MTIAPVPTDRPFYAEDAYGEVQHVEWIGSQGGPFGAYVGVIDSDGECFPVSDISDWDDDCATLEGRQEANDHGSSGAEDGALFTDFYEPLRSDLTYLQAALSSYDGGAASDDVRGAWDRTIAAFRNLSEVCADALNAGAVSDRAEALAALIYSWQPKAILDPTADPILNREVTWAELNTYGEFGWEPAWAHGCRRRADEVIAALTGGES